ncbi:MAG TPA: acyl-CoA dehydrogenase family protein, partial [Polyangiaceae bacterium]
GLAEATALVSSEPTEMLPVITSFRLDALHQGRAIESNVLPARQLVSFGRSFQGTSIVIVDPETRSPCAAGTVGEIWIRGGNIGAGYVGREAESRAVFGAAINGSGASHLRSGDLGFLHDGRLYVIGRLQDRMLLGGKQHYAQDIEATASTCHSALVPYGCAAITVERATLREVAIVQEITRTALRTFDADAVIESIRNAVRREHHVEVDTIALIRPATLPRTTSGKVRRNDCRSQFVEGSLSALVVWRLARPQAHRTIRPRGEQEVASFADVAPGAERLIEWLRRHAAVLVAYHAGTDASRTADACLPDALLRDFAQQGLLGMPIERAYGGLELGYADTMRVLEQLAAVDFHCAVVIGLNAYLGVFPIVRYGSAAIKGWLLPGLAQGSEVAAIAFDEPGHSTQIRGRARFSQRHTVGSHRVRDDASSDRTATQSGTLSGRKFLEGSIGTPTIVNVLVAVDDSSPPDAFVIFSNTIGKQCRLGGTDVVLTLDGMHVTCEQRLGKQGQGASIVEEATRLRHLATAAASVGAMKRCAQWISRATQTPTAFFGTTTPNPITLARLVSVKARVTALECLVQGLARYLDSDRTAPVEAFAACRFFCPQLLLWSIDDFMQLGVALSPAEMDRLLTLHKVASRLRVGNGSPDTVAEEVGALAIDGGHSLRQLLVDVIPAPAAMNLIDVALETIRLRMQDLNAALARRAQRWARTRAGELGFWIVLLGAVEAKRNESASPDLSRAHAWAAAQFEQALASVRAGTPSEAATAVSLEVRGLFAGYAGTIGEFDG